VIFWAVSVLLDDPLRPLSFPLFGAVDLEVKGAADLKHDVVLLSAYGSFEVSGGECQAADPSLSFFFRVPLRSPLWSLDSSSFGFGGVGLVVV